MLSRYLERRADIGAANCLNSIEGGIRTMEEFKSWEDDYEANCSQHPVWKARRKLMHYLHDHIFWFVDSHPSPDQRIASLKALELN